MPRRRVLRRSLYLSHGAYLVVARSAAHSAHHGGYAAFMAMA
jgi:hypothetical protein